MGNESQRFLITFYDYFYDRRIRKTTFRPNGPSWIFKNKH